MTEQEIHDTVLRALRRIAPEVTGAEIDPAASLREQVDLDSVDFMRFVVALAEELKVEIPGPDAPLLGTLAGAVAYLAERLPTAPAATTT